MIDLAILLMVVTLVVYLVMQIDEDPSRWTKAKMPPQADGAAAAEARRSTAG